MKRTAKTYIRPFFFIVLLLATYCTESEDHTIPHLLKRENNKFFSYSKKLAEATLAIGSNDPKRIDCFLLNSQELNIRSVYCLASSDNPLFIAGSDFDPTCLLYYRALFSELPEIQKIALQKWQDAIPQFSTRKEVFECYTDDDVIHAVQQAYQKNMYTEYSSYLCRYSSMKMDECVNLYFSKIHDLIDRIVDLSFSSDADIRFQALKTLANSFSFFANNPLVWERLLPHLSDKSLAVRAEAAYMFIYHDDCFESTIRHDILLTIAKESILSGSSYHFRSFLYRVPLLQMNETDYQELIYGLLSQGTDDAHKRVVKLLSNLSLKQPYKDRFLETLADNPPPDIAKWFAEKNQAGGRDKP